MLSALPRHKSSVYWLNSKLNSINGYGSIHQISSTHQTRQNTPFVLQLAQTAVHTYSMTFERVSGKN
jgi:hypothetical protein